MKDGFKKCQKCQNEYIDGVAFCPHCGTRFDNDPINEVYKDEDPFSILQIAREAEQEVIDAAYKGLARKYHPDNKISGSDEKMKKINWAYETLRDPNKHPDGPQSGSTRKNTYKGPQPKDEEKRTSQPGNEKSENAPKKEKVENDQTKNNKSNKNEQGVNPSNNVNKTYKSSRTYSYFLVGGILIAVLLFCGLITIVPIIVYEFGNLPSTKVVEPQYYPTNTAIIPTNTAMVLPTFTKIAPTPTSVSIGELMHPGRYYSFDNNSELPSYLDVISLDSVISGDMLNVVIKLRDMPEQLEFNRAGVPDVLEYAFVVYVDTDTNELTGSNPDFNYNDLSNGPKGTDYQIMSLWFIQDNSQPQYLPVKNFLANSYGGLYKHTSGSQIEKANMQMIVVDPNKDTITFHVNVPGIANYSTISIATYEYNPNGQQQGEWLLASTTIAEDPTVTTNKETLSFIQSGNAKLLEDVASEQYDNIFIPGETYIYTIPLLKSEPLLWGFFWCAKEQTILEANFKQMKFAFSLNGKIPDPNNLSTMDFASQSQFCRVVSYQLTDWPVGEHHLNTTLTFLKKINDGFGDYDKGIFTYAYTVYVNSNVLPTSTIIPPTETSIGKTQISPIDGMVMVYVPIGNFIMGSNGRDSDEKPVHTVYLDAYWIDQTEVTNAMYRKCVAEGVCTENEDYGNSFNGDQKPVGVDWYQAKAYCEWAGRELPTEAQWEKAARGEDGRTYPWGEGADPTKANYSDNVGKTTNVGSYPDGASPYGALDMAGNVWEWVADLYGSDYYGNSPNNNPTGPDSGEYRVRRGGDWSFSNRILSHAANRVKSIPNVSSNGSGFRCALSLQ